MSRPYFRRKGDTSNPISNYVFMAFLIGVLYLFYLVIRPFLSDLFIAMVMAIVFYPLYKLLRRVLWGWKIVSALITILIIILVFLIPIALLSGVITGQSLDLYEKISKGLQDGSLKKAFDLKISSIQPYLRTGPD